MTASAAVGAAHRPAKPSESAEGRRRLRAALPGLADQQAAEAAAIGVPWAGWPTGPHDLSGWATRATTVTELLMLPAREACLAAALPLPLGWWVDVLDAVHPGPLHARPRGVCCGVEQLVVPLLRLAEVQLCATGRLPSAPAVRASRPWEPHRSGDDETELLRRLSAGPVDSWLDAGSAVRTHLAAHTLPSKPPTWRQQLVNNAYLRLPPLPGWGQPPALNRRQLAFLHHFDGVDTARRCRWRAAALCGPDEPARQIEEQLFAALVTHTLLEEVTFEQTVLPRVQAWQASLLRSAGHARAWSRRPDVVDGSVGRLVLLGATPQHRRGEAALRDASVDDLETILQLSGGAQWYS